MVYKAYIDKMCEIPLVPTLVVELFSYYALSLREHHFDNIQVHLLADIMESITIACVFGITESEDVVNHANKIFEILGYNPKNIMIMTCNAVYVTIFGTQFRQIPRRQRLEVWNFLRLQDITVHILQKDENLSSKVQKTIYAIEDEICDAVYNHTLPGELEALIDILYILCRSHKEEVSFRLQRAIEYRPILLRLQSNSLEFSLAADTLLKIINRCIHEPPAVYVNSLSLSRNGSGNTISGGGSETEHSTSRRRHSPYTSPTVTVKKVSPSVRDSRNLKRKHNTFPTPSRRNSEDNHNVNDRQNECSFKEWDSD
jgi:hypothetical protein